MYGDLRASDPSRLAQKDAFALIGLDNVDFRDPENGEDQSGQTGAAAEIDQHARVGRDQRAELCRIENMAPPDIADRPRTDEIDPAVPGGEKFDIDPEALQCF